MTGLEPFQCFSFITVHPPVCQKLIAQAVTLLTQALADATLLVSVDSCEIS